MRYASLVTLVGLLTLVGCGSEYEIVPVSGKVTMNGKPLDNVMVLTQPVGSEDNPNPGPGSFARTDASGVFVLEMQHAEIVGAVPGPCKVKIKETGEQKESSDDTVDPSLYRSKIPLDYQEGLIDFTIPEDGTDAMDFEIDTKKRR